MIKNILILILTVLLGSASYLLYQNKIIRINIGTDIDKNEPASVVRGESDDKKVIREVTDEEIVDSNEILTDTGAPYEEKYVDMGREFEPQIHLDPTIGLTIDQDLHIVSRYKVIGPRKFALLTEQDRTIVEINLDTGAVTIDPSYTNDEATTKFWISIGKKYPEVCFVE